MNRYQKIIKYTKPLAEIDEKIRHLNERMTTTGMYTVVDQDDGIEEVNPTFEPAPLGDFSDLDDFSWADQGDGSGATANLSQLTTTDVDGIEQLVFDMPDLDYPSTAYAMAIGPNQAVTGSPLGYIGDSGFVFVYQINNVFSVSQSPFQKAFVEAYENGSFIQKSITLWNSLLYRVTDPIQPSQFYPVGRTFDTTPQAERGLYGYNLLIPTENGNIKRNNVKTDDGVRARPPRVNNIISRNDLGDPNYYAGPATNVSNEALNYLMARVTPVYVGIPPRNSPGSGPQNVQGPHQPVKFYPGMGFGPSGPVRPGGFYANSYEPEGEVLSEDLTKSDFARLNKYVKDHPEELEYAFKRYPAGDPRLSKLNFKMDEMTRASDEYVQKQFPENVEQTSRVKKILARNIELSDPKTFKDVKQPMTYGKIYGNDSKDKKVKEKDFSKKSPGRFFKTEKKKDTSRTRWIRG